jgi:ankyrin repeat protein
MGAAIPKTKMQTGEALDMSALFESVNNLRVPRELPFDVVLAILDFLDRPRDIWYFALAILGTKYCTYLHDVLKVLYRRDVEFQHYLLFRPDLALEHGPPALLWAAKRSMHSVMIRALEAARFKKATNPLYIDGLDIFPFRPKPGEYLETAPKPPLLVCAAKNDVRGCQLLLEHGADINIRWLNAYDGRVRPWKSVSQVSRDLSRDHCFRGTHKHCPHYSGSCLTAIAEAASRGAISVVKYLVRVGADTKSAETAPPLHMAVINDQLETVRALLRIDPTLANFRSWRRGDHPLTVATWRYVPIHDEGYVNVPSLKGARIIQLLLKHGAHVEARLDDEPPCNTPLIYAAKNGLKSAEAGSYNDAVFWAVYCALLLRAGAREMLSEGSGSSVPETTGDSSKILDWLDRNAGSPATQRHLRQFGLNIRRG